MRVAGKLERPVGGGAIRALSTRHTGTCSMEALTVFVTGSTDGIGRHTAGKLAEAGATVSIHGRNEARVDAVVASIAAQARGSVVRGYVANLASLQQVRKLAEDVQRDTDGIDVLINNAGVYMDKRQSSEDGFEMTWAVNVVAPFLLTALLMGHIRRRVLNVASISAASHIDFDNLQQEKGFSGHGAYAASKLASQLFTFELARRLAATGSVVTANCCDPGTVNTKMLYAGWGACGIDVTDADDEFFLATDPSLSGISGQYFTQRRQRLASRVAEDPAVQRQLWELLEQQCGCAFDVTIAKA